eukprot:CAMPEP_0202859754 /NCGR_PEP_ID=MMETSP1391-20130828/1736_1 /ASSEMBLY_ACC=CAM_ASM_000867 /TAXON_ID=1034604 /ORGANISM="Chlamydomonas leiostraca, Strain SAG 11-49" /LENGTH=527 /DNA_ID=CAMNT_0049538823 /DNA_START=99 /DNA_END=1682 /DNA_ORIENTATION=+
MASSTAGMEVLTLNTWGLLLVSKRRKERMKLLAMALQGTTADIVALQEVWVEADAQLLIDACATAGMPYAIHFKSGVFGAGLVTVSRYPIVEHGFQCYASAGDPAAIHCGDFYAGKGVGWVRVATPLGHVDVYNTHLHANYSHKHLAAKSGSNTPGDAGGYKVPSDAYAPYRLSQMLQMAQFIRHCSKSGSCAIILAGDLNTKPDWLEMGLLRSLLPELVDSWEVLHGESGEAGHTCRAEGNTFESTRQVPERIDYVLTTLRPVDCRVALKLSPAGCSYSDHFAVQARLEAQGSSLGSGRGTLMSPTDLVQVKVAPVKSPLSGSTGAVVPKPGAPATPSPPLLHIPSSILSPTNSSGIGVALVQPLLGTGAFPWLGGPLASDASGHGGAAPSPKPGRRAPPDMSSRLPAVMAILGASTQLVQQGVARNGRHAKQRLAFAAVCLVLCLGWVGVVAVTFTTGGSSSLLDMVPNAVLPTSLAVLLAPFLSAFAMLALVMGLVADFTQQRVLVSAELQMRMLADRLKTEGL